MDCGYLLEPPRRGDSNKYPQYMFLSRNKKNNVYPCKPQFYYIKVGLKGVKIIFGMFSWWKWCSYFCLYVTAVTKWKYYTINLRIRYVTGLGFEPATPESEVRRATDWFVLLINDSNIWTPWIPSKKFKGHDSQRQKTTLGYMRPAKILIRLRIRAVWS